MELELEEEEDEEEDTAEAAATAAAFEKPEEQWSGEEPEKGLQAELLEQAEVISQPKAEPEVISQPKAEPCLQAMAEVEAVSAATEESNGRSSEAGWEERPEEGVSSLLLVCMFSPCLTPDQQFSCNVSECGGMLQKLQMLQRLQKQVYAEAARQHRLAGDSLLLWQELFLGFFHALFPLLFFFHPLFLITVSDAAVKSAGNAAAEP